MSKKKTINKVVRKLKSGAKILKFGVKALKQIPPMMTKNIRKAKNVTRKMK